VNKGGGLINMLYLLRVKCDTLASCRYELDRYRQFKWRQKPPGVSSS